MNKRKQTDYGKVPYCTVCIASYPGLLNFFNACKEKIVLYSEVFVVEKNGENNLPLIQSFFVVERN